MREPRITVLIAVAAGAAIVAAGSTPAARAQDSPAAVTGPSMQDAEVEAPASPTVIQLVERVMSTGDNAGLPFVVVDKVEAKVFVYGPDARFHGWTPALVGLAPGDDSEPGIGDRPMSGIRPEERTTPAGRFIASYGPAAGGKTVLWVDYDTAVSLHPVVTSNPKEHRLKRLRSADPADNRITYGCINVPARFYQEVVRPAFTGTRGVVYVLPDTKRVEDVFPALQMGAGQAPLALAGSGLKADAEAPE